MSICPKKNITWLVSFMLLTCGGRLLFQPKPPHKENQAAEATQTYEI